MTVVRYAPWSLLNRLHSQFGQVLGDGFAGSETASTANAWVPAVDVQEDSDRFVLRADIPGVDAKDLEITAENGVLTVRGERRAEARAANAGFERLERVTGSFLRRFTLPETVQADAIRAKQLNGVLEITIPKQPKPEPKRVTVETH